MYLTRIGPVGAEQPVVRVDDVLGLGLTLDVNGDRVRQRVIAPR